MEIQHMIILRYLTSEWMKHAGGFDKVLKVVRCLKEAHDNGTICNREGDYLICAHRVTEHMEQMSGYDYWWRDISDDASYQAWVAASSEYRGVGQSVRLASQG